jgi:HEAT repeat protein
MLSASLAAVVMFACAGGTAPQERVDTPQLIAQLSSPDPRVRTRAACALRGKADAAAGALDALVAMLPDGAPVEQSVCERNWGRWNDKLTTTPGEQAASALVAVGKRAFKPLLAALTHESWIARRNAAWALGALDDAAAAPGLVKALADAEGPVREQAAWALGALDEPSAVEPLLRVLKDPDADVRQQAAWALGAIGDSRALDGLMSALKDSNAGVRRQAAWALGVIGG